MDIAPIIRPIIDNFSKMDISQWQIGQIMQKVIIHHWEIRIIDINIWIIDSI